MYACLCEDDSNMASRLDGRPDNSSQLKLDSSEYIDFPVYRSALMGGYKRTNTIESYIHAVLMDGYRRTVLIQC